MVDVFPTVADLQPFSTIPKCSGVDQPRQCCVSSGVILTRTSLCPAQHTFSQQHTCAETREGRQGLPRGLHSAATTLFGSRWTQCLPCTLLLEDPRLAALDLERLRLRHGADQTPTGGPRVSHADAVKRLAAVLTEQCTTTPHRSSQTSDLC